MVVRLLSLFLSVTLLSSCASVQPIEAPKNVSAPLVDELKNITAPVRKVPVAVYKFTDVTGQRKSGNNLALLSSAVTQGGDIWLIQALKKAGNGEWFKVIERMELDIGISDEYRKDMVTVALRLISVQTGEVLLAVSSQKTILSTKLSATAFKFLDLGTKLLETEIGITDNESATYAVRKAIEQAVIEIIKEGERKKLWEFKKEKIK